MAAGLNLPSCPPLPAGDTFTRAQAEDHGRLCMASGVFNERAAVILALDALAREFVEAGRPNTAKRLRDVMAKIEARLK